LIVVGQGFQIGKKIAMGTTWSSMQHNERGALADDFIVEVRTVNSL
jgi:hypothetical protein